jgi:hypothetical protein
MHDNPANFFFYNDCKNSKSKRSYFLERLSVESKRRCNCFIKTIIHMNAPRMVHFGLRDLIRGTSDSE